MRTLENIRRFRLSDTFVEPYKIQKVPWGPLGYVTFKRTYSRRLNEFEPEAIGTEEWWQTCRRVIEGMFNMQKQHVFLCLCFLDLWPLKAPIICLLRSGILWFFYRP